MSGSKVSKRREGVSSGGHSTLAAVLSNLRREHARGCTERHVCPSRPNPVYLSDLIVTDRLFTSLLKKDLAMADASEAAPGSSRGDDDELIVPHPPGFRLRRVQNWFFLGLTYATYYLSVHPRACSHLEGILHLRLC